MKNEKPLKPLSKLFKIVVRDRYNIKTHVNEFRRRVAEDPHALEFITADPRGAQLYFAELARYAGKRNAVYGSKGTVVQALEQKGVMDAIAAAGFINDVPALFKEAQLNTHQIAVILRAEGAVMALYKSDKWEEIKETVYKMEPGDRCSVWQTDQAIIPFMAEPADRQRILESISDMPGKTRVQLVGAIKHQLAAYGIDADALVADMVDTSPMPAPRRFGRFDLVHS